MPDPLVIQTLNEWRDKVAMREAAQMQAMTRQWMAVEDTLRSQMQDLALYLDERRAMGEVITEARLMQMDRYQSLISQAKVEQAKYSNLLAQDLATAQRTALRDGVIMAQDTIAAAGIDAGIRNLVFDRINVNAVDYLIGFASDGTPLYDLLRRSYPDSVMTLTSQLAEGLASGAGPRTTARIMADGMAGNLDRALTIARTEQLRALRTSNLAQLDQSNVVEGYIRRAQRSGNVCPACLALDGTEQDTDEVFESHPNCLVPGTKVSGAIPEYVMSRFYQGDVISLRTASGNFLTITPNHPILTDRGWIAAQFLKEGDNVIASGFNERTTPSIDPDYYHVPTLVENIARSLGMFRLGRMPITPEDFHCDGEGSNVSIIFANRLLRDNYQSGFVEPFTQYQFGLRNIARFILSTFSSFTKFIIRTLSTPYSIMGSGGLFASLGGSHLGSLQFHSLGHGSNLNSLSQKRSANNCSSDMVRLRDLLLRDARTVQLSDFPSIWHNDFLALADFGSSKPMPIVNRPHQPTSLEFIREALLGGVNNGGSLLAAFTREIQFDPILDIGVSGYSGHVYNLQNKDGWYIANGIITHNCACFAQPKLKYGDTPEFPSGPEWFDTLPEEQQKDMLGSGRFELFQNGELNWDAVATIENDPTWGPTIKQATLDELRANKPES